MSGELGPEDRVHERQLQPSQHVVVVERGGVAAADGPTMTPGCQGRQGRVIVPIGVRPAIGLQVGDGLGLRQRIDHLLTVFPALVTLAAPPHPPLVKAHVAGHGQRRPDVRRHHHQDAVDRQPVPQLKDGRDITRQEPAAQADAAAAPLPPGRCRGPYRCRSGRKASPAPRLWPTYPWGLGRGSGAKWRPRCARGGPSVASPFLRQPAQPRSFCASPLEAVPGNNRCATAAPVASCERSRNCTSVDQLSRAAASSSGYCPMASNIFCRSLSMASNTCLGVLLPMYSSCTYLPMVVMSKNCIAPCKSGVLPSAEFFRTVS